MAKKKEENQETTETVDQKSDSTAPAPKTPEPEKEVPALESLAVLADRHRVPTWQQAALCRLMGWEDGKMVANAEYLDALDKLKTRRVGGGRMG